MAAKDAKDTDAEELARLMMGWMQCSMRLHRSRDSFRAPVDAGVTIAQMHALHALMDGAASISKLTERLEMSVSAVSHLVQRLVEMGFVSRTESEADRRQKHVALSGQGKRLVEKLMKARFEDMRASLEELSPELRRELRGVLERVVAEMGAKVAVAQRERVTSHARDFAGADLAGMVLSDKDLEGARFNGANLEGAVLDRCNLRGASFIGANLEGASLQDANLEDARFKAANLEGAKLCGARLTSADFEHAHVEGVAFDGANVEAAKRLPHAGTARRRKRTTDSEDT